MVVVVVVFAVVVIVAAVLLRGGGRSVYKLPWAGLSGKGARRSVMLCMFLSLSVLFLPVDRTN